MGKRFDACTPRPKHGGGTWWHRVGSAFENDKGQVTVYLDSVPVPDKERGNIVIMLFEPKERERVAEMDGSGKKEKPKFDDEIPF